MNVVNCNPIVTLMVAIKQTNQSSNFSRLLIIYFITKKNILLFIVTCLYFFLRC